MVSPRLRNALGSGNEIAGGCTTLVSRALVNRSDRKVGRYEVAAIFNDPHRCGPMDGAAKHVALHDQVAGFPAVLAHSPPLNNKGSTYPAGPCVSLSTGSVG